jgi:cytochrome bd-type quinol oxidase subunit 1
MKRAANRILRACVRSQKISLPVLLPTILFTALLVSLLFASTALAEAAAAPSSADVAYRAFPKVGSRVAIWVIAQLHLYFAAFVLAVPIFALIIEYIGYRNGDKKFDKLAHEFTKLLSVSFSLTASLGAVLTFMLIVLYPKFTNYFASVFGPTFFFYVALFFAEAFFLYTYYYGWGKFSPRIHLLLGVGLNIVGTAIMFIANGWVTFMTSPAGIDKAGNVTSVWEAVMNPTWMPINIHRIIANVAFGGSIAAAYGAFKFLSAETDEERAHYDWMGYIGNFIAIAAFLPLPFAGYWLGKEIYGYSQNLGMTLMGGAFSWLFIIQAILIGMLFLSANFYLWLGMGRIPGAERFRGLIKYILIVIMLCFGVWATPSSMIATAEEMGKMGGSHHPTLKFLGVMSAKNTAVNMLILSTYISFLLYRRGNKQVVPRTDSGGNLSHTVILLLAIVFDAYLAWYSWGLPALAQTFGDQVSDLAARFSQIAALVFAGCGVAHLVSFLSARKKGAGGRINWSDFGSPTQFLIFLTAISFVIFIGIYGYLVPTAARIKMSVPQVVSVLVTMILVTAIDVMMFRNAKVTGGIQWGKMRPISQYCLFFTAITFTWLMGLMGYVRSGLRQHWHVYQVMKDTSPDAYTPTLGFASSVVSVTVLIFFCMVAFVFWLASLTGKKNYVAPSTPESGRAEKSAAAKSAATAGVLS